MIGGRGDIDGKIAQLQPKVAADKAPFIMSGESTLTLITQFYITSLLTDSSRTRDKRDSLSAKDGGDNPDQQQSKTDSSAADTASPDKQTTGTAGADTDNNTVSTAEGEQAEEEKDEVAVTGMNIDM